MLIIRACQAAILRQVSVIDPCYFPMLIVIRSNFQWKILHKKKLCFKNVKIGEKPTTYDRLFPRMKNSMGNCTMCSKCNRCTYIMDMSLLRACTQTPIARILFYPDSCCNDVMRQEMLYLLGWNKFKKLVACANLKNVSLISMIWDIKSTTYF